MAKKKVYFNAKTIQFVKHARQKLRVLVAGRGFGKTTSMAWITAEWIRAMPRGRFFIASTTLDQIKEELLPVIIEKWRDFGLKENIHFVIGKRPPEWYASPYKPPKKYDNTVSFFNGCVIVLRTNARADSKRGGNYDAGLLDEASFIDGGTFKSVYGPMLRPGMGGYRWDTHWYRCLCIFTSRPRKPKGYWVYEYKKRAGETPDKVLYMEASAYDNKAILKEEYFEEQKIVLGDDYDIEILNKEKRKIPTGYYHTLDRLRNCYRVLKGETDTRPQLLEISFDFGGKFNCACVWQEENFTERCIHQFHVKKKGKVEALVDKVCNHYKGHPLKYIRIYGDPRGWDRNPYGPPLYELVVARFNHNGWAAEVIVEPGKRTTAHKARYTFMAKILAGTPLLPTVLFNEATCPDLLIAMEICDVKDDFQKDKDAEKDDHFPQEHAPHYTDTVDYYLYQKHGWRLEDDSRGGYAA